MLCLEIIFYIIATYAVFQTRVLRGHTPCSHQLHWQDCIATIAHGSICSGSVSHIWYGLRFVHRQGFQFQPPACCLLSAYVLSLTEEVTLMPALSYHLLAMTLIFSGIKLSRHTQLSSQVFNFNLLLLTDYKRMSSKIDCWRTNVAIFTKV